jgi:hypothetical protein
MLVRRFDRFFGFGNTPSTILLVGKSEQPDPHSPMVSFLDGVLSFGKMPSSDV